MAEEAIQEVENVEESPQGETEAKQTDWKAEARKWEQRAKKSQAAETELEMLKQAQMTEQEKATARAEKAEAELATLKAEAERVDAARQVSTETGVPFELLHAHCSDAEAMDSFASDVLAFAKKYQSEQPHVSAAASATRSRILRGNSDGARSHGELFADAVSALF